MSRTNLFRSSTGSSTPRIATSARIVAVVVMALLAATLAYLRLAARVEAVSVPAGASAGDLILQPCDYLTEKGTYRADCGTLVVPENRTDPRSRLIAVPVSAFGLCQSTRRSRSSTSRAVLASRT